MEENLNQFSSAEQSKKERRAEKRLLRERGVTRTGQMRTVKKIAVIVVAVLILAGAGWGIWKIMPASAPTRGLGPDLSRSFESEGANHVAEGTHVVYKTNPPTSGNHWSDPVRDGIYDKSQPDEGLVHSLEHGRIWISYKPSIPQATKDRLKEIARTHVKTILTVREANETDVALAAWARLDTFNLNPDGSFDEGRVLDFLARYTDQGPEKGIPAMTGRVY